MSHDHFMDEAGELNRWRDVMTGRREHAGSWNARGSMPKQNSRAISHARLVYWTRFDWWTLAVLSAQRLLFTPAFPIN